MAEHRGVRTAPAVEDICARAAHERVVAGSALEQIVPGASVERIVTGVADQPVAAAFADQHIVPVETGDDIVPRIAAQMIVVCVAGQPQIAAAEKASCADAGQKPHVGGTEQLAVDEVELDVAVTGVDLHYPRRIDVRHGDGQDVGTVEGEGVASVPLIGRRGLIAHAELYVPGFFIRRIEAVSVVVIIGYAREEGGIPGPCKVRRHHHDAVVTLPVVLVGATVGARSALPKLVPHQDVACRGVGDHVSDDTPDRFHRIARHIEAHRSARHGLCREGIARRRHAVPRARPVLADKSEVAGLHQPDGMGLRGGLQ
ncbi:hypothetical protein A6302_00668 [Methylobrevis pamukkalensis]|uniref:Uncharacterized protein n=1 Tax=Methylobrevis pamukkalensis TaxID=1439726 RepID=A0A1E3H6U8_9HYPH|nr:hypothetical protein A6302_00668 [Methylobrevis pamukkalensis]